MRHVPARATTTGTTERGWDSRLGARRVVRVIAVRCPQLPANLAILTYRANT